MKRATKRRIGLVVAGVMAVAALCAFTIMVASHHLLIFTLVDASPLKSVALSFRDGAVEMRLSKPQHSSGVPAESTSEFAGIEFRKGFIQKSRVQWHAITIPIWPVVVLLAAFPSIVAFRITARRWRSRLQGHCNCGYNLTGNVSGVCPECGTKLETEDGCSRRASEDSGVEKTSTKPDGRDVRIVPRGMRTDHRKAQIKAIMTQVRDAYAGRIRAAKTEEGKAALESERDAEIARQVEQLSREEDVDTPECL